ncbi:MAG: rhodanese-like domain-containing protein [Thiohalomonadales bacterium]
MNKNIHRLSIQLLLLLLIIPSTLYAKTNTEFPGRAIYPYIKVIGLQELKKQFNHVDIVDVRSAYEFQTLKIKGAISIPLASRHFKKQMRELRAQSNRPIIVYCNGKTCMKSYKAATKSNDAKIKDVFAYDAGIMDWAKKYPQMSVLLGDPLKSSKQLISKQSFKKHNISPETFGTLVSDRKGIVLDIRDRFQREGMSIFAGAEKRVTLDNKRRLDKYIAQAKKQRKPLIVFDAAGKQVRWLQYYLEKKKLKKYYFMDGGIRAYIKTLSSLDNR